MVLKGKINNLLCTPRVASRKIFTIQREVFTEINVSSLLCYFLLLIYFLIHESLSEGVCFC